jgi:hypothetical protein
MLRRPALNEEKSSSICCRYLIPMVVGRLDSSFGLDSAPKKWKTFARALRQHGKDHDVSASIESRHGTRYSVDGALKTPDGRNPNVRTVWVLAKRSKSPRLVRAYPI